MVVRTRRDHVTKKQTISFDAGKLQTGLEVIANQLGKKLDEDNPLLHAQLPDGSRLGGGRFRRSCAATPALVIRKFTSRHYTVDDLITRGTLTRALAEFLAEQIRSGKTLLISGGTGTGKTTLLRILADFIPEQDRIVVIEDTSELQIQKPNILPTECQTDTFKANDLFRRSLESPLSAGDRTESSSGKSAESRHERCSIPSTRAMRVRWLRSTPTRPRKPFAVSPISSCAATRKRPFPILKQRSQKLSISSSMWNVSPAAASSARCLRFAAMTATRNASLIEPVFEVQHATPSARSALPFAAALRPILRRKIP